MLIITGLSNRLLNLRVSYDKGKKITSIGSSLASVRLSVDDCVLPLVVVDTVTFTKVDNFNCIFSSILSRCPKHNIVPKILK